MEQGTTHKRIVSITSKGSGLTPLTFHNFKPPTSNTTYTPNQFFDVVIPHFSRGVVRIVAYLLRKTLGLVRREWKPSGGGD